MRREREEIETGTRRDGEEHTGNAASRLIFAEGITLCHCWVRY